jgi:multiple sugar transport system permease protein
VNKHKEYITAFIFLAPWLCGLFAFTLWPFLESCIMSFQKTNLFSKQFIGLRNYHELFFNDSRFIKSVFVTVKYVLISVPLKLSFALFVAMLLKGDIKGMHAYRTVIYIPSLIGATVAVAAMWTQLFGTDGLINSLLALIGIPGRGWIAHPSTALGVLIVLAVWQFGSSMVIFLAGLKNIPNNLYEACRVDGGSRFDNFIHITIPMLSPIILFNFVLQTIGSFQIFTQSYLITRGGPMDETLFMVLYIYNKAFMSSRMGFASAMSWMLLVLIVATTGIIFFSAKHWVYYASK